VELKVVGKNTHYKNIKRGEIMIINYKDMKAEARLDNLDIITDNPKINKIIKSNKIQKVLLMSYFGNVDGIVIDDLI